MVPITSLWLPILLSAAAVFVVSSLIHMVLGYHKSDYRSVPRQDELMAAMRPFNIAPGDYLVPFAGSMAETKSPAFTEKITKGPVFMMTVMPNGHMAMGSMFTQWFLYLILVSVVSAYVAGEALGPGAPAMKVLQFAGCTAFASYALGTWPASIWYKRSWLTTFKSTFDGLIFGVVTGGVFAWLWP